MAKMVQYAITVSKTGTAYVTCSEDEHHPEKLIDDVDWGDETDWDEVVDSEIIDGWEEDEEAES
jgi:hypothetical protein